MLRHGNSLSSWDVKWVSGLLSSSGRELGLYLEVQQGSETSLRVVTDTLGSIHVGAWESILISSQGKLVVLPTFCRNRWVSLEFYRWDRPPLEIRGESQNSTLVEAGISALISRRGREHGALLELWLETVVPLEFQWVSWETSWVA